MMIGSLAEDEEEEDDEEDEEEDDSLEDAWDDLCCFPLPSSLSSLSSRCRRGRDMDAWIERKKCPN